MEVGDYVRTRDDGIQKITFIDEFTLDSDEVFFGTDKTGDYADISTTDIIGKPSPNIIDLIEENDLLKIEYYSLRYEKRVTRLFEVTYKDKKNINLSNAKCDFMLTNNDFSNSDKELEPIIKSIVTKEQFESMEYKLEENK